MDDSEQAVQAQASQPKVFVRESTGLVKNVGFFDSIAMNMSNMSVGALLGVIGIAGFFPMLLAGQNTGGVNLVVLSVLAFVLSVPQIVVYTVMSRRFPRTGGDYVWVSRVFGGPFGSVLSFMGYTMETTAYLALIVLTTVFSIGAVGLFFTFDPNLLGIAVPSQVPGAIPALQFIVGALIFGGLIGINILKPKAGFKLVTALTIFGFFALVLAMGVLLMGGTSGVQNFINHSYMSINGTNTYNVISSQFPNSFDWGATIFLLPLMAAFVYPWLNASPAVAGEIKGRTALKWNVPISSLLVFIFLTSSMAVMYFVAGPAFTNNAYTNPTMVFNNSFNFWTLAMGVSTGVTGNSIVASIIGLGWILSNLSVLAYGVIVISRYLLAQSFDRFLPSRISQVSSRFGSPITAHLVDLVITLGLVFFAAYAYNTGGIGGADALFGAILASMVYFIFVGLAAAIHGMKREKGGTKWILMLAGVLNVFVFGFLSYQFITYPVVWALHPLTYYFIGASIVAGALIYISSWWYNKRRGIDISLAYKELPPE
ncbi:MAG: amino acid permease [Thaumarchaeota archaeon]|nr:amino acid permease [Nitrososphaerota archaeon]